MRNYHRRYNSTSASKNDDTNKKESRSKVIIDENTIYEIDLDCYECMQQDEDKKVNPYDSI